MLVGIWTNGSHLEMPVVLFFFFFFFICPYQLPVAKDGTSFTAKQYVVRLRMHVVELQKQKAREAPARIRMCAYSGIFPQRKLFLSDSSVCSNALSQICIYACQVPGKD